MKPRQPPAFELRDDQGELVEARNERGQLEFTRKSNHMLDPKDKLDAELLRWRDRVRALVTRSTRRPSGAAE
jgi:hypothetical protein